MNQKTLTTLQNKYFKLSINNDGEINSIKYLDQEILHQGKKWWYKTYPMIWPNISFSTSFEVDGRNYVLPKHGFWKTLNWQAFLEEKTLVQVATHLANEQFPFNIDIEHRISLNKNTIKIATYFRNLDAKTAFFSFGHHPAFLADQKTLIKQSGKLHYIDNKGLYQAKQQIMKPVFDMDFGNLIDTYVFKNLPSINASFQANDLKITLTTNDFNSLMVWRPKDAEFICVEPMQGWGDHEYEAPALAKQKREITTLESGQTKCFTLNITIEEIALIKK